MRTPAFPVLILVAASLGAAGCRPTSKPVAAPVEANAAPEPAQTPIKPLPGIAEERPAPANLPSLDVAETAQAANPSGVKENQNLAFAYYQAKAYAQAAPAFQRVIQLSPKDPTAYLYLGYTQMTAGALEPAIETFDALLKIPGVGRDALSLAYLHKGYALGALGKTKESREAFVQSLGNNTKQGLASLALGGFAAEQKQLDQARDFFQDAVNDLAPGRHQARAYAGLGVLAEQAGDRKAAQTYYEKALAAHKEDEDTWARDGLKRLASKPAKAGKTAPVKPPKV